MSFYPSSLSASLYFSLPEWCRNEMKFSDSGFVWSGHEALGWSWFSSGSPVGSILPSEPSFFLPFYEEILADVPGDLEMESWEDDEKICLRMSFLHGEEKEILNGKGDDRLEAMLDLLSSICSFYMVAFRPSLNDASSEKFLSAPHWASSYLGAQYTLPFVKNGNPVTAKNASVDVITDVDGVISLNFSTGSAAAKFAEHYKRFLTPATPSPYNFYGTMSMMEGEARIYANYGEEDKELASALTLHNSIGTVHSFLPSYPSSYPSITCTGTAPITMDPAISYKISKSGPIGTGKLINKSFIK